MIRPATLADAQALADLWNRWIVGTAVTFAATPKTRTDLAGMIATRPVFLTSDDCQAIATYDQFRGGNGYATCMEHTILLAPDARHRGLGRALLSALEDHARALGAHQMIGGISGENPAAIAFHSAMGYREVARISEAGFKFNRFMDLVLMRKFLT